MSISTKFSSCFFPVALLAASALYVGCASEPQPAPETHGPAISSGMAESIHELGVSNASIPTDGLLCAGQLSPEQMNALSDMGFASFVCLRMPTERGAGWEEAHAEAGGIAFQRLPIAGADGVTEEAAMELSEVMANAERPMVLYCGSSNRVGALLALKAHHVENMPADEAIEFGKSAGLKSLEPKVRGLIAQ